MGANIVLDPLTKFRGQLRAEWVRVEYGWVRTETKVIVNLYQKEIQFYRSHLTCYKLLNVNTCTSLSLVSTVIECSHRVSSTRKPSIYRRRSFLDLPFSINFMFPRFLISTYDKVVLP